MLPPDGCSARRCWRGCRRRCAARRRCRAAGRAAVFDADVVAAGRQRCDLLAHLGQQRPHVDDLFLRRRRAGFEGREREQVVDQALHAAGLVGGKREVVRGLVGRNLSRPRPDAVAQGLDETRHHGQRGLEFMRDIGDEIAAHGFESLELGHVARQQQGMAGPNGAEAICSARPRRRRWIGTPCCGLSR